jgi:hypothetical protein
MTDQKQLENVEHFSHLGSVITNYATRTRKIKSKIAMEKAPLIKKTFQQKTRIKLTE